MRYILVFVALLAFFTPVIAQGTQCTLDLSSLMATLAQVEQAVDTGDGEATRDGLASARAELALIEGQCLDYAPETAGDSRTNPVPHGQRQRVMDDDLNVSIQMEHYSDDAEEIILSINRSNEPAPDGKRYVAMTFKFICEASADESCEYSRVQYSLVGDKGISYRYDSGDIRGVGGSQEIFGGAEITVGVAFLVDADDGNFVMFTEYARPRVYFVVQPPE